MHFENYYTSSLFVSCMIEADKRLDGNKTLSRKRKRESFERDDSIETLKKFIQEWDAIGLYPTFKTFVDKRFYIQLSTNENVSTFNDLLHAVVEFKSLILVADNFLQKKELTKLYLHFVGPMYDFLRSYQQMVMLFNLQCNSQ